MSEPSVTVELFDAAEMDVQIRKMAHQVLGDFRTRNGSSWSGSAAGVSVADRLAAHLSRITGRAFDQGRSRSSGTATPWKSCTRFPF